MGVASDEDMLGWLLSFGVDDGNWEVGPEDSILLLLEGQFWKRSQKKEASAVNMSRDKIMNNFSICMIACLKKTKKKKK